MSITIKTPAQLVIEKFGGVRATARAIGRAPSSVSRWRQPEEDGGCGGQIPRSLLPKILSMAQERGYNLDALDLIRGRVAI